MKGELVHMVSTDHYTEGPAMDVHGNVYFTTLTGGSIMRLDKDNELSVWSTSVCPNGQVILANGDHLVCDSRKATVVRFSAEGRFIKGESDGTCNGQQVFVPNDLTTDDHDGFYYTDSIPENGKVCYQAWDGSAYVLAAGLNYPNGLTLSRDRSRLFVAESYNNRILSIPLAGAGPAAGEPEVFCYLPAHESGKTEANLPDGLALDQKDRLWVAHYGMQAIQVLDIQGKLISSVQTPFPLVSNVFFSTQNAAELIVTGGYGEPGPGAVAKLFITE